MSDKEEKEITLRHNDNYEIKVKIKNNYQYILNAVKEALYYSDDEMENITLNFVDEDGDDNMLDEDNVELAFEATEWTTSKKDTPIPKSAPTSNEEVEKLKAEISQLKSQLKNSNSLKETFKKCNEKYKVQLEQLKNKFIEELKQRETLNKKNIEQIEKDLIDCAQNMIRSKVEKYNNDVKNDLNSKIEQSKVNLNKGIKEIESVLKDINTNKDEIKKQIGESNTNFSLIFEMSKINDNK